MSYGSGVVPSRTRTKFRTSTKGRQRAHESSEEDELDSSDDDERPKQRAAPKQRRYDSSTDNDETIESSGDDRRRKQSAKARKSGANSAGSSKDARKKPAKRKEREATTEEDSDSSTDDRGSAARANPRKRKNRWADANGRENMSRRERNRKPGGRVNKKGAFPGEGRSLVEPAELSDDASTFGRHARSRTAREARAVAAESRTSVVPKRKTTQSSGKAGKKPAKPKARESSEDEAPKRPKKLRKAAETDSEDIDVDSDRPSKKLKKHFQFSDPELQALVGLSDSDSDIDQLDNSDDGLPDIRSVTKGSKTKAKLPTAKDIAAKIAVRGGTSASGSARTWTASKSHRDAPIPPKIKRPEQKFFSNAQHERQLKENLASGAAERRRASAAAKKAREEDEWESSDVEAIPRPLRPAPQAKSAKSGQSKKRVPAGTVIEITDSGSSSD